MKLQRKTQRKTLLDSDKKDIRSFSLSKGDAKVREHKE